MISKCQLAEDWKKKNLETSYSRNGLSLATIGAIADDEPIAGHWQLLFQRNALPSTRALLYQWSRVVRSVEAERSRALPSNQKVLGSNPDQGRMTKAPAPASKKTGHTLTGLTSAGVSDRDVLLHRGYSTYTWITVCMIWKSMNMDYGWMSYLSNAFCMPTSEKSLRNPCVRWRASRRRCAIRSVLTSSPSSERTDRRALRGTERDRFDLTEVKNASIRPWQGTNPGSGPKSMLLTTERPPIVFARQRPRAVGGPRPNGTDASARLLLRAAGTTHCRRRITETAAVTDTRVQNNLSLQKFTHIQGRNGHIAEVAFASRTPTRAILSLTAYM
ncbi:hypothetical protein EVAR_81873_1 [Eumeta japonica]|uniref:Uncharacterized protein n=1 Tax=Eumeta variegata TaxID=151549 RepID=A0A4C1UX03_EUMVA|nr:hypothetical protein EVAR_81873_1 [Eumeta japonica]